MGQEQTWTGATTGNAQIERKSTSELTIARIGTRRLRLEERAKHCGPSTLEAAVLLETAL
jgi:hypothetical protein